MKKILSVAFGVITLLNLQLAPLAQVHGDSSSHHNAGSSDDTTALKLYALYILDALHNLSGGVKRGGKTMGNLSLSANLDTEKAGLWPGGSIHLHLQANHGGSFSDFVGDLQTVSHIEAPASVGLFEAYYQQRFAEDRLSLLAGLYAVDSEFDTRHSSSLFVHSSPGTGGDLGQLGQNGIGIFPVGALGLRLRYENAGWYVQTAFLEGIPGDPDEPHKNTMRWDADEGFFSISEVGHVWKDEHGELGKIALGGWGYSERYSTHSNPEPTASNRGGYLSLEKTFIRESDPSQGLAGFLRLGVADGRVNPIENFVGVGIVYTGPFEGRDKDRIGFAYNGGFAGTDYLRSEPRDSNETNLELTYSFHISDNFSLQPDVQYVINPGFDPSLDDSFIFGLRAVSHIGN